MSILLKRDTKVFIEKPAVATATPAAYWEIPVLDGFTFTQGNTTTEVTLSEMDDSGGNSRRGRRMFNDALDPVEWSISTYIRPFKVPSTGPGTTSLDTGHHAVEEALWAHFVGTGALGGPTNAWDGTIANLTSDGTDLNVSFANNNKSTLGTFNMYFVMGAPNDTTGPFNATATGPNRVEIYKLTGCTVNEATINFDVEGIAQIDWSGNATTLTSEASTPFNQTTDVETGGVRGITATDNYIRNKLTQLTVAPAAGAPGSWETGYNFTLTGGSITFSNNITYLTPETLGEVNTPLGHITGNVNIAGNFTCYLTPGSVGDSGDFLDDVIANSDVVTNEFDLAFSIGGANAPKLVINLDHCHLEIPQITTDDVIGLDINFHALPDGITGNDEADLVYTGE
jgi:hypothetical protein